MVTSSPPSRICAGGRQFQPGDHAQRRRLAAARRPEQDEELAVVDGEVGILDRDERRRIPSCRFSTRISAIVYSGNFETMMNIAVPDSMVTNDQV